MTAVAQAPSIRVLLVDDDDNLRATLARSLTRAGCRVETEVDGHAGAARVKEGAFDVVVSDIAMPGMTGIEMLCAIRAHDLDVPVILMTANASLETAIDAVKYGALRYLQKPFEHQVLVESVEQAARLFKLARAKREAMVMLGHAHKLLGDRAGLEARFSTAVDDVWMAYQPIVSWNRREVYAYEALVRSNEPTLPHPGALFDAAERLHQLPKLGRAIRRAVAASVPDVPPLLFVNLHTRDLADDTLFASDAPLSRLAPGIVLEITERASLDEVSDLQVRVDDLRRMGFRIAVDDLGAGYAGLTSFSQLKPDVVKLDMSLIRGIDQDSAKQRLVGSMIALCRDLGILAVVEGVETIAERDALVTLGADLLQGYLFAKPARPFPDVAW